MEALARELPASAVSLHFLAALLAEGQGGPHGDAEAARRNLAGAVERAGKALPITLARRHVAAEQNRRRPNPDCPGCWSGRRTASPVRPEPTPAWRWRC